MWGQPMFDLQRRRRRDDGAADAGASTATATSASPASIPPGWESVRISFLVNRPAEEPDSADAAGGGRARNALQHGTRADGPARNTIPLRAEHSLLRIQADHCYALPGGEARSFEVDARRRHATTAEAAPTTSSTCARKFEAAGIGGSSTARPRAARPEAGQDRDPRDRLAAAGRARAAADRPRHRAPTLHMSFTGNPGTGKTTVALRMAGILHRLGFIRSGQLISVTRDDLVGQYIGHTAPKTKEILKKAMGGVLFIDEAYYLYRPENERDYGQEAIEILLQVMENQREDLVVILAGYRDRMDEFFATNPGFRSRIAHHIDFPDYDEAELLGIAELMLREADYRFTPAAREAFEQLHRAAAGAAALRQRALDPQRARPHPAAPGQPAGLRSRPRAGDAELATIDAADILASRVFNGGAEVQEGSMADPLLIAPSILSADFARLGEEVAPSMRRRRLDPFRCDGRPFCAEHHHRPRHRRRSGR